MYFPLVLVALLSYALGVWLMMRMKRFKGKTWPVRTAWVMFFLVFLGDHCAGYLFFKWYTAGVSIPGPVTLKIRDMAIENYTQAESQAEAERGNKGHSPIANAWHAAKFLGVPLVHSKQTGFGPATMVTGLSRLEIVDVDYGLAHPTEAPMVRKYSIVKRPDARCTEFEAQPERIRKAQFEFMTEYGLASAEQYCVASEVTRKVTSQYTIRQEFSDFQHPRSWTIAALVGVYPSHFVIVDNQSGQAVFEGKRASFYGGWVSQFVRIWPEMTFQISNAGIETLGIDSPCCRATGSV